MDHTTNAIYHPANTRETLPLPLALRYFESEPCWRTEPPRFALRDSDERLHCDDGVAVQFEDFATEYWRHGRAHREDGLPAIYIQGSTAIELPLVSGARDINHGSLRLAPNTEICCVDGLIHSDDGAAIVNHGDSDTFRMEYWCRGRRHCADGVAVETSMEKIWFYHGLVHREDGPAYMLDSRLGELFVCYWYGRRFSFDKPLDYDFPADEPPPLLILHALAYSDSCPDFENVLVASMIARACELMPELSLLSGGVEDSEWESFRTTIWTFLHEPEKYQMRASDTLPLPAGIGEDCYPQAGDVVADRKVA
jgi:hypothetical protein